MQAHRYVLFNSHIARPFLEEYHCLVRTQRPHAQKMEIDRIHQQTFHTWFKNQVEKLEQASSGSMSEELKRLTRGPKDMAKRLKGFVLNGVKFHTKAYELNRKTQTSGVMVNAKTLSYSSSKDKNPIEGVVTYYGVLTDIMELDYYENHKVILFRCDWVDIDKGMKEDEHGFKLVNFSRLFHSGDQLSDDPFVLASQAEQVFYVQDPLDTGWHVASKAHLRGFYNMLRNESVEDVALWEMDYHFVLDNEDNVT